MKRAKHNLSNYRLLTTDMGYLTPCGLWEVLPGDTFQHSTNCLIRMSPMAAPVMHPIQVRVHHFFVPNRLLWDGWENFITGGPDGDNSSVVPTVTVDTATYPTNVLDYLGVKPVDGVEVNALPLYAFNMIYNEYYRDQDLQSEFSLDHQNIKRISWEKDYLTTARPWEQKGSAVTIPLGDTAPISATGPIQWEDSSANFTNMEVANTPQDEFVANPGMTPNDPVAYFSGLEADLSNAQAVGINEFRRAFALQRYQEARARYGSRYTEYLRYLGVRPSDARLQRPEYLGGGRVNVSISEVLQTGPETGQAPTTEYGVGDLYGHGIAATRTNKYRRFFEEHGYVISLLSVRPKSIYVDGIPRHFVKRDKEDYYQRELAYIGQQPVYNSEVYAEPGSERTTFGYQDRYDEYRMERSQVSGEFRELLNYWHLGREFTQAPVLNNDFVECDPGKRIFNEQTQDSLWVMCQHNLVARRMVPQRAMSRII